VANLKITPQTVLLTSGQAVTFQATDAGGQPVAVSWSLNPPIGTPVAPVSANAAPQAVVSPVPSVTYVAPPLVAAAQMIALIASTANDSGSATIALTPDAIAIVPAKVELKADQSQQFVAIVAAAPGSEGVPTEKITWILSPPLGSLDQTGLYQAPHEIADSTTLNVIATGATLGKQAVATVNLASPPWQGIGVNVLGAYLLAVFLLVFLMVGLWPPALPSPDTAKANRIEAERTLDEKTAALENAEIAVAAAQADAAKLQGVSSKQAPPTGTAGTKTDESTPALEAAKAKLEAAKYILQRAQASREFCVGDLEKKRGIEETVNDPNVRTKLARHINRELDLLWLVLLGGALGSFLHTAQSYSDYVGNGKLKSNWAWWYAFRPFIGAGLALVFYAAVRGGFMAIATGTNVKASELNPFGVVSVAALVGMFSKAATTKLGEVFDTVFRSDKTDDKDALDSPSQTSNQAAGKATTTSTATK
jgi:hypothetical protein